MRVQKPNGAGRGKGHLLQCDLCSARPNDKTLKVKESTKARESVHSKDNKPQNRNLKLSLSFREITWGEAWRGAVVPSFGRTEAGLRMEGVQPFHFLTFREDVKLWETPFCSPCLTHGQEFCFQLFYFLVFMGHCASICYPWPRFSLEFSHSLAFLSTVSYGSLQSFLCNKYSRTSRD